MKKSRFTTEQIIGFIKQADAGMAVAELCRQHGFSPASFYQWRAKYGGMEAEDAKRLKELELENHRLALELRREPLSLLQRTPPGEDCPRFVVSEKSGGSQSGPVNLEAIQSSCE